MKRRAPPRGRTRWLRQTLASWASELRSWWQALATTEGVVVGVAVGGFLLAFLGFLFVALDWDRLLALTRHGGRCVQYLTNEKAAFFIVGVLSAALLSTFFVAEAIYLYTHRARLRRRWSGWLLGLGISSLTLWLLLIYALTAWCF